MKRAVSAGSRDGAPGDMRVLAKESALALLARSIDFGHRRLAVIRLAMAVKAGADVPAAHWDYCRDAVIGTCDAALQALFEDAAGPSRAESTH